MFAYDFSYDGKLLSEFGFMVCTFDGGGGQKNGEKGSEIDFNLASARDGKTRFVAGSQYKNCLSATFQICKNPKAFSEEEMEITSAEFQELSRWLNRREFLWFHSFDYCEPEKVRPWYRASFSLTRIDFGGTTFGIELNMTTDSPFGYGEEITEELQFTRAWETIEITDHSDEIGELYPDVEIVCGEAGELQLFNDKTECGTVVENCTANEIIRLYGDALIIQCSLPDHDIANDFNYEFFRIGNSYGDRVNQIRASMPCTVTLRYRPIRKDSI